MRRAGGMGMEVERWAAIPRLWRWRLTEGGAVVVAGIEGTEDGARRAVGLARVIHAGRRLVRAGGDG